MSDAAAELNARCIEFRRDGATMLRNALSRDEVAKAERAFQWSIDHPGDFGKRILCERPGGFYQDHANPRALEGYRPLLFDTQLAGLVGRLMGSEAVWLLYEQIWLKEGGDCAPTPWHQDLPYMPMSGQHLATTWLCLDPVPQERSLEFVAGSHHGPLFNPTAFDAANPRAAMFEPGVWPDLPDIEATRERWPLVSWAVEPGDVIVFHPAVLHGGAATRSNERRRTISLRFFGDDACCASRPEVGLHEADQLAGDGDRFDPISEMARRLPGTPFRHPAFARLL